MGSKCIYTPIVFKELTDEQARTDCFQENLGSIQWLQGKHLLASHKNCSRCSVPMNFTTKGYALRYPHCYTMKSIRDASFFVKSKKLASLKSYRYGVGNTQFVMLLTLLIFLRR